MSFKLQQIAPRWAKFCLGIESFVKSLMGQDIKGKRFLVALSGGPDSMALLRVLNFVRPRAGIILHAAHLNHQLRQEADDEQEFVRQECLRLEIPLETRVCKIASLARTSGTGVEEAARSVRYDFLAETARHCSADYIATGHHLNDLAEDVLMRMLRGTGWPGLSGMTGFDPQRKLVRPLILTPKKTILDFIDAIGQGYVLDSSNQDRSFLRNRIRLELMPVMEDINPNFLSSIESIWKLGRVDEQHWKELLDAIAIERTEDGELFIRFETLNSLPQATRLRLYKKILDELGPGQAILDNIFELDECWMQGVGGKQVMFPGNKIALIQQKGIRFMAN